jgi:hypothetical protein
MIREYTSWKPSMVPLVIPDDDIWRFRQDQATVKRVAKWQERDQLLAVAGHKLVIEDGSEIAGEENEKDEYGAEISSSSTRSLRMEQVWQQAQRNVGERSCWHCSDD